MAKKRGVILHKKLTLLIAFVLLTSLILPSFVMQSEIFANSSPRAGDSHYNYGEALQKSLLFYKANRLGDIPDDYILPYRSKSAMTDGEDVGLDLTGGWADAGDGIKFTHTISYTASQLGWAVYEFREAFENSGLLEDILDEIKWGTDYLIKCNPEPDVLYYLSGHGESDHSVWIPHELLEYRTDRSSFRLDPETPGSDVAGMAAAALTIASLIFEETDPEYAEKCLMHAERIFDFGYTYQGRNPLDILYPSGGYVDDLAWGATWLHIKTGEDHYLDKAISVMPVDTIGGYHTHCWDDVSYGTAMKIAQITGDEEYVYMVERNLDFFLPGGGITYSPGGLAWLDQWGSLRYATTAAFLAFVWSEDETVGTLSKKDDYREFAERQINYALGDNPRGGSYMVGFGEDSPKHPHHRTAHSSWVSMTEVPEFNRHILYGALVGGPDADDHWVDDIDDYIMNEVAIDYNAGFVGALAKMYDLYGGDLLEDWPQPEDFIAPEDDLEEYFVRAWRMFEGDGTVNVLFQVNNRSARPPTMKDTLSARYFMDLTEVFEAGYDIDAVELELGSHEGATLHGLEHHADNIYYFTVDFTGTKIMPAEWTLCQKEANVSISYRDGVGTHENDWSYPGIHDDPDYCNISFDGMTPLIPIYDEGVLLWGEEPPGGETTPDPEPTPEPDILYGDLNGDGVVDSSDYILLSRIVLEIPVPEDVDLEVADLNGDGIIDSTDTVILSRYILEIIDELPHN
ncbi:glycoside hydrolase family 9 protein [Herbivorax sp. ANBcel31]|uniref:glycoside hydrolase family 9 protein n=1 Tax=Herbivorax sp. ANBcel31 TaxID=3069754 RepID=UPI0027B02F49|nr:glycoside hydrolase family 9 protein [Herbivorax sp. ANBcel31]MDQ2085783.1 glycoside hydrolase family 9 protein [Herbivorax sp. ANBcel31]